MIGWRIYSISGQLLAEKGQIGPFTEGDLEELIQYPFRVSGRRNCHQFGRTINGESYNVFVWHPHHQIIIDNERLRSNFRHLHSDIDQFQFWEKIPRIIRDQLGSNYERFLDENLKINIAEIGHTIDLRSFLGYYGFFSFELSRLMEHYNHRNETLDHPYLVLEFPNVILIKYKNYVIYIEIDLPAISSPEIEIKTQEVEVVDNMINHATDIVDYMKDISTIIDHIKHGDIYQANYTQQFSVTTPPLPLFEMYGLIKQQQELPHAAFLNYSDTFQVMSLSPELFLLVSGGKIVTKPIKGTRSRGETPIEDLQYIEELVNSEKDQAELAMIVDLLRNDLGKSANPGSVEVERHAEIESYENVHHLVSTISATIEPSLEASWRLLLRAFPGGSISGVPKLRSLEIIESLEKVARGIYTGNIGFLGLNGDLEFNIAIRTAIRKANTTVFHAGGGIVLDSDPFSEYLETLHKAKHLAKYLGYDFTGHIIYYDGAFHGVDKVQSLIQSYGVFETILIDRGETKCIDLHRSRIENGIKYLGLTSKCPTDEIITKLLALNLVTTGTYRLNIYCWRDQEDHVLMKLQSYSLSAGPYKLQLSNTQINPPTMIKQGLKSLDYDIYKQATQEAMTRGIWDTILFNTQNMVLEGGRSTIYYFYNQMWYTPKTDVVHGTIRQILLDQNIVKLRDITVDDLLTTKAIAVSNALIGIQRIDRIQKDGTEIWITEDRDSVEILQKGLKLQEN